MRALVSALKTLVILSLANFALAANDGPPKTGRSGGSLTRETKERLVELRKELEQLSVQIAKGFKKGRLLMEMMSVLIEWVNSNHYGMGEGSKRSLEREIGEMEALERELLSAEEKLNKNAFPVYNEGCALFFELGQVIESSLDEAVLAKEERSAIQMMDAYKHVLKQLEVYERLFGPFRKFASFAMELGLEMPQENVNGDFSTFPGDYKQDEDNLFDIFLGSHALPSFSKKEIVKMANTMHKLIIKRLIVVKILKVDAMDGIRQTDALFKRASLMMKNYGQNDHYGVEEKKGVREVYEKLVYRKNQVDSVGKTILSYIVPAEEDLEKFNEDVKNCLHELLQLPDHRIVSGKIRKRCMETFKNSILTLEAIGEIMADLVLDSSNIASDAQFVEHYFNMMNVMSVDSDSVAHKGEEDEYSKSACTPQNGTLVMTREEACTTKAGEVCTIRMPLDDPKGSEANPRQERAPRKESDGAGRLDMWIPLSILLFIHSSLYSLDHH